MRQSSVVGMHFDAVQHVNEYMEMPQEPPGVLEGSRPPAAVRQRQNDWMGDKQKHVTYDTHPYSM
jgi:hypothetical protein